MTVLMLGACASASGDSFCRIYEPIYTLSSDSEATLRQIDRNNAVWLELCADIGRD